MQWLLTVHVRWYHQWHESSGHVWQGRFKAFPIEQDAHLLTVLRYIERNPVRASMVTRAEDCGVECTCLERVRAWPLCGSGPRHTAAAVAQLGKRADDGHGTTADPTERESQRPVRIGSMDCHNGGTVGSGCEPPTDRTPTETSGNVECPRCFVNNAS
jgi:hypothetical protein